MTAQFGDRVTIPLRPFLGILGVSPPPDEPPRSSAVPGNFGGNIDCSDLTAGSVLYFAGFRRGRRLLCGRCSRRTGKRRSRTDRTGNGIQAAQLRLSVVKGRSINRPQAETPNHFITMGLDADLRGAARQEVLDMIDLLAATQDTTREDAYALSLLQADLLVTQLVNGVCGIHARTPKAIFGLGSRR